MKALKLRASSALRGKLEPYGGILISTIPKTMVSCPWDNTGLFVRPIGTIARRSLTIHPAKLDRISLKNVLKTKTIWSKIFFVGNCLKLLHLLAAQALQNISFQCPCVCEIERSLGEIIKQYDSHCPCTLYILHNNMITLVTHRYHTISIIPELHALLQS